MILDIRTKRMKFVVLLAIAQVSFVIGFFLTIQSTRDSFPKEATLQQFIKEQLIGLSSNDSIIAYGKELQKVPVVDFPAELPPEVIKLTREDVALIAKMVAAESRGESFAGQKAVAEVIINRLKDSRFPNTVIEVLYDKGQFSPIADGSFERANPTDIHFEAVLEVLKGDTVVGDALFFYNPKLSEPKNVRWFRNNTDYVTTIGKHEFRRLP